VFPYPVTRGGYQNKQLDLVNKSRPIGSGFLGRSAQMTGPGSSPLESHDGRPDSSAALIGAYDTGLLPTTSASGSLTTMYGAPTRVGEVGRQASYNSDPLPPDAAPPDHYSHSGGSVSVTGSSSIGSHRRLLQAINSPPSLIPPAVGFIFLFRSCAKFHLHTYCRTWA
jgi:hypothetical protein